MKKSKKLIYCLMALCLVSLISCDSEKTDYVGKVVGEYNINITPNINVKYGSNIMPISVESINTTCTITEKDEEGNVIIRIAGVNGLINEIVFEAYCDGWGMKVDNNHYDGLLYSPEYGVVYCDINLKNPTVSIYNSRILSWESTVSGTCDVNISGLDNERYEVSGNIQFEANGK